ncbi:MAG TPA: hypothetical protein VIH12_07950 [Solibacillus sp.]
MAMNECKYCGEQYDVTKSDAKKPDEYCSALCEIIEYIEPELNE